MYVYVCTLQFFTTKTLISDIAFVSELLPFRQLSQSSMSQKVCGVHQAQKLSSAIVFNQIFRKLFHVKLCPDSATLNFLRFEPPPYHSAKYTTSTPDPQMVLCSLGTWNRLAMRCAKALGVHDEFRSTIVLTRFGRYAWSSHKNKHCAYNSVASPVDGCATMTAVVTYTCTITALLSVLVLQYTRTR